MNVADAALYLAEMLAPLVVLRSDLEHVGWLEPQLNEITTHLALTGEGLRAVFCVPPRVVSGTATLVIEMSGAAD